MRTSVVFAWCCLAASLAAATVDFSNGTTGECLPGWTAAITGQGSPEWQLGRDDTAPSPPQVLRQSSETPRASFPLCIKEDVTFRDGWVQVKFKTLSGKIDQAAGLIWRVSDKDNYYVCRANALEDNVVLYKVHEGKRTALDIVGRKGGYGVEAKVTRAVWHSLRVEFAGQSFKVLLDGRTLFQVVDDTFRNEGKVGLWTKADSVTAFDDFSWEKK